MANRIETVDYNGNTVICTNNQWYNHVIKNHAIMARNQSAVEDTIQFPDKVYSSDSNPRRSVFFKNSTLATYGTKYKTKVIVEYSSVDSGEVVTAFPVKDEKGGIKDVIYPEQS